MGTRDLCLQDSDGDGQPNGLELGDPDCVWSVGSVPTRTTDISHPGYSDSTTSFSGTPNLDSTMRSGAPTMSDQEPSRTSLHDDDDDDDDHGHTNHRDGQNHYFQHNASGFMHNDHGHQNSPRNDD